MDTNCGQNERPRDTGAFLSIRPFERLLQSVANRSEGRVEFRAHTLHNGDNRDRNTGGDEAVLNGGGARLILHETSEGIHGKGSLNHYGSLRLVQLAFICRLVPSMTI